MRTLQRVVIAASLGVALVALVWPYLPWTQSIEASTKCPMGYTADSRDVDMSLMPADHPPVLQSSKPNPELMLLYNCTILTMNDEMPVASAVLIDSSGRIQSVHVKTPVTAASTRKVDMQGRMLLPGFVDAHLHIMPGGLTLGMVDLHGIRSKDEFIRAVESAAQQAKQQAAAASDGGDGAAPFIVGSGWDDNLMGGQLPTAEWIDQVTGDTPAILQRMDAHMAVVNTAVLKLAGIDRSTQDPADGSIDRDSTGQPTGILRENAVKLATALTPEPSKEQLLHAFREAAAHLLSKGITTVGDMGRYPFFTSDADASWRDLEQIYEPLAAGGGLPLRVVAYTPMESWQRAALKLETAGRSHTPSNGRLHQGGVKAFADGSLGSRTALMWEPYADDASTSGVQATPAGVLRQRARDAAAAGLQVTVHAIGDRAVDEVLDIYQELSPPSFKRPASTCHHRIEHVQHISGDAAARKLTKQGSWAVANPHHLLSDQAMLVPRLGEARAGAGRSFPLATLAKVGAHVGYGSDWPVVEADPLLVIYAAAFRKAPGSSQAPWEAGAQVPVLDAVKAHTAGAASALCLEHLVGSIRQGLHADFVVLDSDIRMLVGEGGSLPQVGQVWLDGKCVHGAGCPPSDAS